MDINTRQKDKPSFMRALTFALRGIVYVFHTETNMKRHFWLFNLLALIELILRPPADTVAISVFIATCVFAAELFNTAIELAVDAAVNFEYSRIAGLAKDAASGAVAMVCFGSLFAAVYILVHSTPWRFRLFSNVHPLSVVILDVAIVIVWALRFWPMSKQPK